MSASLWVVWVHYYCNFCFNSYTLQVVDAPALADITQQVINTCIDNPNRSVLSVMEEARQ